MSLVATPPTRSEPSRPTRGAGEHARRATQVAALAGVALLLTGALSTPGFLTLRNAQAILASVGFVGIIALGMTLIMISGSVVSLSLGTTTAVCAMVFLATLDWGIPVAILTTLVAGGIICAAQGFFVGSLGANPLIITIAAGALQEAGVQWVTGGASVYPPAGTELGPLTATYFGLPFSVYVLIGLVLCGQSLTRHTRWGRHLHLIGENRPAAYAAALPVGRTVIAAFALAGCAAATSGVLVGAFNQNATMLVSGTFTFDAIAATLVGGSLITGGRGSLLRTCGGVLFIAMISDLMLLRGYSTGTQMLTKGVIVLVAIVLVYLTEKGDTQ